MYNHFPCHAHRVFGQHICELSCSQTDRQNEQQTEKQQRLHNSTFHSKNAAHILTVCGADKVATGQSLSVTGHGKEQIHLPQGVCLGICLA